MTDIIEGVIEKMHTKSGTGKRGSWTKYSAVVNGGWVNFGFDNPGYTEGQSVRLGVEQDQYGMQVKRHRLSDEQPENKPADVAGKPTSGSNRELGMAWGNVSNVAASLIVTMKDMDALPITATAGKANKAKRFAEIMDIYDKLRVRLFADSQDPQRVIDNFPDFGDVETNEPTPLPDGRVDSPEEEEAVEDDNDDF